MACHCLICGLTFTNWSEKQCHRLNTKKSFLLNNTVVLCTDCKKKVVKDLHVLFAVDIMNWDKYFTSFPKQCKYIVLKKMKQMLDKL